MIQQIKISIQRTKDAVERGSLYNLLGNEYAQVQNFEEALKCHIQQLRLIPKYQNDNDRVITLGCIAETYRRLQQFGQSQLYFKLHRELATKLNIQIEVQKNYCNSGLLYHDQASHMIESKSLKGDIDEIDKLLTKAQENFVYSLKCLEKMIKDRSAHDFHSDSSTPNYVQRSTEKVQQLKQSRAEVLYNIANVYFQRSCDDDQYISQAIQQLQVAAVEAKQIRFLLLQGKCYCTLGIIYQNQKQYDEAILIFQRDQKICIDQKDVPGELETKRNLANAHHMNQNFQAARKILIQAIETAKQNQIHSHIEILQNNLQDNDQDVKNRSEILQKYNEMTQNQDFRSQLSFEEIIQLASDLNEYDEFQKSSKICSLGLQTFENLNSAVDYRTLIRLNDVHSVAYQGLQNDDRARTILEQNLSIYRENQIFDYDYYICLNQYTNLLDECKKQTQALKDQISSQYELALDQMVNEFEDFTIARIILNNFQSSCQNNNPNAKVLENLKQLEAVIKQFEKAQQSQNQQDLSSDSSSLDSQQSDEDASESEEKEDEIENINLVSIISNRIVHPPKEKSQFTQSYLMEEERKDYPDDHPREIFQRNKFQQKIQDEQENHNQTIGKNNQIQKNPQPDNYQQISTQKMSFQQDLQKDVFEKYKFTKVQDQLQNLQIQQLQKIEFAKKSRSFPDQHQHKQMREKQKKYLNHPNKVQTNNSPISQISNTEYKEADIVYRETARKYLRREKDSLMKILINPNHQIKLESMNLDEGDSFVFLKALKRINQSKFLGIKSLDLEQSRIFPKHSQTLKKIILLNQVCLEKVNLSKNYLQNENFMSLFFELSKISGLTHLNCSNIKIQIEFQRNFLWNNLKKLTKLQQLALNDTNLTVFPTNWEGMSQSIRNFQLKRSFLDLEGLLNILEFFANQDVQNQNSQNQLKISHSHYSRPQNISLESFENIIKSLESHQNPNQQILNQLVCQGANLIFDEINYKPNESKLFFTLLQNYNAFDFSYTNLSDLSKLFQFFGFHNMNLFYKGESSNIISLLLRNNSLHDTIFQKFLGFLSTLQQLEILDMEASDFSPEQDDRFIDCLSNRNRKLKQLSLKNTYFTLERENLFKKQLSFVENLIF